MSERPIFDTETLANARESLGHLAASLSTQEAAGVYALLMRAATLAGSQALGLAPPPAVLAAQELKYYDQIRAKQPSKRDTNTGALTVILKATRLCNLRCTYCHSWRSGPNQVMTFPVLARAIQSTLQDSGARHIDFVWHGGEVTLLQPGYLLKALWLQEQFRRPGQIVRNSIQTNGTLLDQDWIDLFQTYQFGIGVSLDGPPDVHDRRRLDPKGRPTSARVRKGLSQLRQSGVRNVGVLMVVDDELCRVGARRVLEYLIELEVPAVAFLNVIPENTAPAAPMRGTYLPLPRYVQFLLEAFRLWWSEYRGRLDIRELSSLALQLNGSPARTCVFAGDCFGYYLTIEPDGNISACDKYVGDDAYSFGHVLHGGLGDLESSPRLHAVRESNRIAVDRMRLCPWFQICHGGCPHDTYTSDRHQPGKDSSCCGMAPLLEEMNSLIGPASTPKARSNSSYQILPTQM